MTSAEMIEGAFRPFEITSDSVLLAKRVEIVETTGDELVGISLMSHIPDNFVPVEIEGLVEGQGQFDNPKTRSQMSAAGGDNLEMSLADLASDVLQFRQAESMQLVRMGQISEMHAQPLLDQQSTASFPAIEAGVSGERMKR